MKLGKISVNEVLFYKRKTNLAMCFAHVDRERREEASAQRPPLRLAASPPWRVGVLYCQTIAPLVGVKGQAGFLIYPNRQLLFVTS